MTLETSTRTLLHDGAPFTRREAADLGLGGRRLSDALRDGALRRVLQSVYVDERVPDSRDLRCACLHLVMPSHAVLFGTSAAWPFGVDAFQPEDRFVLTPQCVVPHGRTRCTSAGVRTVEGHIAEADITELNGLRLTVPERTTVDMLRRLRRPFALSAADAMAHAGLVVPEELQYRVDRLKGYPGIVQARQLVRWVEPLTESGGESWYRLRLIDAGYPRPTPQFWVCDRLGRPLFRLDLAYPHLLIACEYDGAQDHTSVEDTAADQRRRDQMRQRWGWRFAVGRKSDILGTDPWIEIEVGRMLGREPLLPRRW